VTDSPRIRLSSPAVRLSSILLLLAACAAPDAEPAPEWIPLFDGASLDGWTPKIAGHELGEDPYRTFRVEDGLLKVAYDGYERFDGRFGHLFFHAPFERCRLRIEYRFVGAQCAGGPGWAVRNSGVMLLCQPPETMALGQEFPVSIEAQMLGGDGEHARPTANLCTPGTHVVIGGELVTRHCVESRSPTFHGERWVVMEVEVGDVIRHRVDGEVVLEYDAPQLDPGDPDAQALLARGVGPLLHGGYVALQAESHPLEIRRVEVLR
jgi:hypothetical protein